MGTDNVTLHRRSPRRRLLRTTVVLLGINTANAVVVYPVLISAVGIGWATGEVVAVLTVLCVAVCVATARLRRLLARTSTALYCPPGGQPCYVTVDDEGDGLAALRFASALTVPFAESEQGVEVSEYAWLTRCPRCDQLDTHLVTVCTLITRECLACNHSWKERLS